MKEIPLYNSGIGINNKVPPHRLPFGDGGVSAFESATDVLVGRTGDVLARRGSSVLEATQSHSGWATNGGFYLVQDRDEDSALYKANQSADGSLALVGIRSGLTRGKRFSYTDVDGTTYYTNGYEHGMLNDVVSSAWTETDWSGSETTEDMLPMPVAKHIDFISGRFVFSSGKVLGYTEVGLHGTVNNTKDYYQFESNIIMICAVQSGVFISDEKAIYFLAGIDPNQWEMKKVANYPAVEYARNQGLVDPSFLGLETSQLSGLFGTVEGSVVGLPDGSIQNFNNKNITLPSQCGEGSIMVVDETMILQS